MRRNKTALKEKLPSSSNHSKRDFLLIYKIDASSQRRRETDAQIIVKKTQMTGLNIPTRKRERE